MKIYKTDMMNVPLSGKRITQDKLSVPDFSSHVHLSSQFNRFNQKPLKQNSKELSFKGFSVSKVKVDDVEDILGRVTRVLGDTFKDKYEEVAKNFPSRIVKDGKSVEFTGKSIFSMVAESLVYPIARMPFDLADFGLNMMKKVPFLKKPADAMYNSKFLTKIRKSAQKDEDFNAVMGMFDQVSKKVKEDPSKNIDDWIFKLSQKSFNPKLGKYNSVHERSLNRIVSGVIPAFFLANDAYNLSRFCDDNSKMADKEHDTRFRQELSRVGITAYIQLVILGGLTKFVNSSLLGTAVSSTIPVLISETSSRLMNGKSITFISKDKAKKMAKEQGVISIKDEDQQQTQPKAVDNQPTGGDLIYKYYPMPVAFKQSLTFSQNESQVFKNRFSKKVAPDRFKSYAPQSVIDETAGLVSQITADRDKNSTGKGLLSLETLAKASVASVAIGFTLQGIRKNKKIDTTIKKVFNNVHEKYLSIVKEDLLIKKADFDNICQKLEESGCEKVAQGYRKLMAENDENTGKIINLLQEMLQNHNTPQYDKLLKDNASLLANYQIGQYASKGFLKKCLDNLKSTPSDSYRLAPADKKYKPAVDFVIAPFRFMWQAVSLPHRAVKNAIGMFSKSKPKPKGSSLVAMTNGLRVIQENAKKLSPAEFKKFIEQTMSASFNNITKSDYSNADLGKLTKLFASSVTTWFLIADDYNMVMMKSLGEDQAGASLKAKERFQQRITGMFYQTLFIDLFNNTFSKIYHESLLGMSAVTGACTTVCEVFTRKSIGKPIGKMSRDEINELEYKNTNAPGLKGKYFRFMTELTGKKVVSADANKKMQKDKEKSKALA